MYALRRAYIAYDLQLAASTTFPLMARIVRRTIGESTRTTTSRHLARLYNCTHRTDITQQLCTDIISSFSSNLEDKKLDTEFELLSIFHS